ncbi:MAG: hypothetical protein U0936_08445 [Planctomycetaceae bacterium]
MSSDSAESRPIPLWLRVFAAGWMLFFLYWWFREPLQSPELKRSDLWLMMADTLLGVDDSSSEVEASLPVSGIKFLPQRLRLLSRAFVILCLASCHGMAFVRGLRLGLRLYRTERMVLIGGIGLAVQSLITLVAGLAGQLNPIAICLPSAVSLLVAWRARTTEPLVLRNRLSAAVPVRPSGRLVAVVLLVTVPFVIYLLLGSLSPPTDFDVREYHLQGPKEWFQQGRISYLRHNVYTSFPFLSEMLPLTAMVLVGDWWEGALAGQAVLACFQLLTACVVFAICTRWLTASVAWLATLIYLTTPWTLRISLIAYAEGALTFYLVSSAMVAFWLIEQIGHRRSLSFLAGLLGGCAMASKYTGLVSVIVPTAMIICWGLLRRTMKDQPGMHDEIYRRDSLQSLIPAMGSFAAGVALMIAPWLLRNLYDTGNPVFPLGYSIFGGSEWSPEMNARWIPAHSSREHSLALLPRHFMDVAIYNMWTSGLLFALSIPAMLLIRRIRTVQTCFLLIGWGFATWWALTHRIDRFWIPLIPLLSITAACSWLLHSSGLWRGFLFVLITAGTSYNVYFCTLALVGFHAGLMDLNAARKLTIRSDIQTLNDTLPSTAKVLMVGDAEVFDTTFPLVYNTVFDDNIFEDWTVDSSDAATSLRDRGMLSTDKIRQVLTSNQITHIHVHWGEILRYRVPGSYDYTAYVQPSRFSLLVSAGVLKLPRAMLVRPWSSLSAVEQKTVSSWAGYESVVANDAFSIVQFYEVAE